MKDYLYFKNEQLLVWNAGYIQADISETVQEIIGSYQYKQILELLLNKTIDYINQKKSFYEEITKHPDIELKLSDQEYEKLRKELFG